MLYRLVTMAVPFRHHRSHRAQLHLGDTVCDQSVARLRPWTFFNWSGVAWAERQLLFFRALLVQLQVDEIEPLLLGHRRYGYGNHFLTRRGEQVHLRVCPGEDTVLVGKFKGDR